MISNLQHRDQLAKNAEKNTNNLIANILTLFGLVAIVTIKFLMNEAGA
jgi:hypothetical protein